MGKRLNPHRRLLAKQAAALNAAKALQSVEHAREASMLQQGNVRSSMAISTMPSKHGPSVAQLTRLTAPRPMTWEGRGKTGKVQGGKFKASKPGTKKLWSLS